MNKSQFGGIGISLNNFFWGLLSWFQYFLPKPPNNCSPRNNCSLSLFHIHFNWRLITLQYCSGFAIHCNESATGVHVFPILNSHFSPHLIPLGHPSAPTPSTLSHALNLDWWFISHIIIYMFQCHSPKSSHPHPLPYRVQKTVQYICVSFAVSHIGLSLLSL